jgi:hypothetical protein
VLVVAGAKDEQEGLERQAAHVPHRDALARYDAHRRVRRQVLPALAAGRGLAAAAERGERGALNVGPGGGGRIDGQRDGRAV